MYIGDWCLLLFAQHYSMMWYSIYCLSLLSLYPRSILASFFILPFPNICLMVYHCVDFITWKGRRAINLLPNVTVIQSSVFVIIHTMSWPFETPHFVDFNSFLMWRSGPVMFHGLESVIVNTLILNLTCRIIIGIHKMPKMLKAV